MCGVQSSLATPRRVAEDTHLPGGYLRVHLHPKRFPAAHATAWRTRIIRDEPEFVAVNKPSGIQVPPTVDNWRESLLACTEQVGRRRGAALACAGGGACSRRFRRGRESRLPRSSTATPAGGKCLTPAAVAGCQGRMLGLIPPPALACPGTWSGPWHAAAAAPPGCRHGGRGRHGQDARVRTALQGPVP